MTDPSDVEMHWVTPTSRPDLDAIESDLAGVEMALVRLDTGEYWRDEITGAELDEAELALHPTARRSAGTDADAD